MKREEVNKQLNEQYTIILNCESELSSMDYIGTKIAMGVATKEDYTEQIAQTEVRRQQIRDAKAEIERLKAIVPDDDVEPINEEE